MDECEKKTSFTIKGASVSHFLKCSCFIATSSLKDRTMLSDFHRREARCWWECTGL